MNPTKGAKSDHYGRMLDLSLTTTGNTFSTNLEEQQGGERVFAPIQGSTSPLRVKLRPKFKKRPRLSYVY
jgi:hypothetical protein